MYIAHIRFQERHKLYVYPYTQASLSSYCCDPSGRAAATPSLSSAKVLPSASCCGQRATWLQTAGHLGRCLESQGCSSSLDCQEEKACSGLFRQAQSQSEYRSSPEAAPEPALKLLRGSSASADTPTPSSAGSGPGSPENELWASRNAPAAPCLGVEGYAEESQRRRSRLRRGLSNKWAWADEMPKWTASRSVGSYQFQLSIAILALARYPHLY